MCSGIPSMTYGVILQAHQSWLWYVLVIILDGTISQTLCESKNTTVGTEIHQLKKKIKITFKTIFFKWTTTEDTRNRTAPQSWLWYDYQNKIHIPLPLWRMVQVFFFFFIYTVVLSWLFLFISRSFVDSFLSLLAAYLLSCTQHNKYTQKV